MGLPVIVFVASIIHIIFKLISASIEKKIINNGTEIMATFVTYYHSLILIEGKNADVVKIKFKYKDKKNKDYFYTTAQIFTSAEAEYFKKLKCTKLKILNGRCTICDPINIDVIKALTCQNPNDTPETIPENTISKETVSKTKKCDFCGCEIDADAKFCNKCGGKQDDIK